MLRVNPRVTFLSKMGYIFIKFGSEWSYTVVYGSNLVTILQITRPYFFLSFSFKKLSC